MKKQTTTEWLFKQLWDEPKDKFTWYAILSKAKAMEKEQIITVYWDAYNEGKYSTDKTAEQYYQETYGGNNE